MHVSTYLAPLTALLSLTQAHFPPTPQGVTTLESADHSGASLSYKQVRIAFSPGINLSRLILPN